MSSPLTTIPGLILLVITYYISSRSQGAMSKIFSVLTLLAGILLGVSAPAPMRFDVTFIISVVAGVVGVLAVIGYSVYMRSQAKTNARRELLKKKLDFTIQGRR